MNARSTASRLAESVSAAVSSAPGAIIRTRAVRCRLPTLSKRTEAQLCRRQVTAVSGAARAFSTVSPLKQASTSDSSSNPKTRPRGNGTRPVVLAAGLIGSLVLVYGSTCLADATGGGQWLLEFFRGRSLNETSFEPFTIIAREVVSPTSFIITVKPRRGASSAEMERTRAQQTNTPLPLPMFGWPYVRLRRPAALLEAHSNRQVFEKAWEHGLWSVEVKQPLIQVAREYTPLPPRYGQEEHELDQGILRFLIRTVNGGSVSHYLASVGLGEQIELRGPHLGFDVPSRLGGAEQLGFLAGGTGIAPALQTIRAVLDRDGSKTTRDQENPTVAILWANRASSDCLGCDELASGVFKGPSNAIVAQLAEQRARHGDRLRVACTVDERRQFIASAAITNLVKPTTPTAGQPTAPMPPSTCWLHSPALLPSLEGTDPLEARCSCTGTRPGGASSSGKKLMMVSGPDGFTSALAGPKRWADGKERQGPVGGMLGDLKRKSPGSWADWLVLKL